MPTKDPLPVGAGRPSRFGMVKLLTSQTERGRTSPEARRGAVSPTRKTAVEENIVGAGFAEGIRCGSVRQDTMPWGV